jgi:hypothetical protein
LPNATTGANLACTRPNLDALIASTLKKRVTVKVDCAALQMALDQVLKHDPDPDRREQVCAMLERDGWWEAASFAAFHCQCQALRGPLQLKPWQSPPCFGEVPYASTAPQLRRLVQSFPSHRGDKIREISSVCERATGAKNVAIVRRFAINLVCHVEDKRSSETHRKPVCCESLQASLRNILLGEGVPAAKSC